MRELNYIKPEGINDFSFFQIPTKLFMEPYSNIEMGSKVLYGVLLSRVRLSIANGWIDDDGHVYIRFSNHELAEVLGIAEKTITRYKKSLSECGLLRITKDGMDSYRIYVMNINSLCEEVQNDDLEMDTAEAAQNDDLEMDKKYHLDETQCTSSDGHFVRQNISNNIYINNIECEGDNTLTPEQYDELICKYGSSLVEKTVKRAAQYKNCLNYATIHAWIEEARTRDNNEQPQYRRFDHRPTNDEWSELELELLANRPGAVQRGC